MHTATLHDFIALNDQLAALVQAGVPIDLGLSPRGANATGTLEKIGAAVTRRVGQGATLSAALDDEPSVPPAYRGLMQLALQSGDLSLALGSFSRTAESLDESWHVVRSSLFYPLLVVCLAYAGFIAFCLFLVPTLENTYYEMRIQPASGLRVMQTLRATMPYWVALPPIALLLVWGWIRIKSRAEPAGGNAAAFLAWLPGISPAIFEHRCANFAESLASFLDASVPLKDGLHRAAGAWGDDRLEAETRALASVSQPGPAIDERSPLAMRLPPLLRWAVFHSDETIGKPQALRMAASTYRESAQRRAERLRVCAPLVTCVVIGGGVTLLYGLALFVPVVQMLQAIAS